MTSRMIKSGKYVYLTFSKYIKQIFNWISTGKVWQSEIPSVGWVQKFVSFIKMEGTHQSRIRHCFFLLFGHSFIPGYGDNRGLCGHRGINNDSDKINYSCLVWVSLLTKISITKIEFEKKIWYYFHFTNYKNVWVPCGNPVNHNFKIHLINCYLIYKLKTLWL